LKQLFSLRTIHVSVLLLFLSQYALPRDPYRFSAGAGEAGMGFVCIMRAGFWSSFHNQALLAYNTSFSAGIDYRNRFCIPELGLRTAGIIIPAGSTSIGMVYSHFGYHDFRRQTSGIACGLSLSERIAAGVQIDYFSEKTSGEYDNNQLVTCEAGMVVRASDNTTFGVHLFNPVPNSIRKSFVPTVLTAGVGVELSKVLFAGAEVEMTTGEKLILRTGFEYEMAKKLWLRGGLCTDNTSFSFGLGYLFKSIRLDLAFATHEKLGITSSASIIIKIK
jgi:hypothetical protein